MSHTSDIQTLLNTRLDEVEKQIVELDSERDSLRNAIAALVSVVEVEDKSKHGRKPSSGGAAKALPTAKQAIAIAKGKKVTTRNEGESRKDAILALLGEGLSPQDVATELGIKKNYVYHVRALAA